MSNLYKIESYCETSVKRIEECIRHSGGQCVVRGWAIITNYVFDDQQSNQILHLISKITDELSDDDVNTWSNYLLIAA